MRNPINMLSSLQTHSSDRSYIFERLYRNLFNRDLFLLAYQNIYSSQGNMTKGADGKTVDAMSMARIDELIAKLRDESYQPQPSRRTYIPKKNGKMRPLGIPSFDDKLVQEALRMMLEAIYEGNFEDISHGFRPNHSCHTALNQIQVCFTGAKWFVEGDIKGFFDNINHDKMVPLTAKYASRTSLIDRLKAKQCEFCGKEDCEIEIHHVRKLKDLSGKSFWEAFMIARRRKTLALCQDCHDKLHSGKLN